MSDEYKVEDLFFLQRDDAQIDQIQSLESVEYPESLIDRWDQWIKAVKG